MTALEAQAQARGLTIAGGFHPTDEDNVPKGTRTLVLLAPDGTAFWERFTQTDYYLDGKADPVDRWSRHIIGTWACDLGAKALFPFGGPPYQPFQTWALRTGRAFSSPIGFLVHADQGLMISFRGALALKEHVDVPAPSANPCAACAAPCKTACPVSALSERGYDVPLCKSYLADDPACMTQGCAVRRICPISETFDRPPQQSAFHMKAFR